MIARAAPGPNLLTYHNDWRAMGLSLATGEAPALPDRRELRLHRRGARDACCSASRAWIALLPGAAFKWKRGRVTGIACRGGVTVDLTWDADAGALTAELTSRTDQQVRLHLPEAFAATGSADQQVTLRAGEPLRVATPGG
jgi:hypothetical protein